MTENAVTLLKGFLKETSERNRLNAEQHQTSEVLKAYFEGRHTAFKSTLELIEALI